MRQLLEKYIDKEILVQYHGLKIKVIVKDVKRSYGNTRYLITPVAGAGEVWVESL